MKNKLLVIILFILLLPTIVLAKDTCNDNDIIIKSISLKSSNGFTEEVNESTISNNKINLDLKMYNIGDSIEYNILIKNNSSKDYYFTSDSLKIDNDYLEYSLLNGSEEIKSGEEKNIQLKITYKNKIPNITYNDTNKVSISLSDTPLINPSTVVSKNIYIVIMLLIISTIFLKIKNKKKVLLLTILGFIPVSVYAACNIKIEVETKIEIDERKAIFLPGQEVNIKMKELAGDDTSTVTNGYYFQDENITAIRYSLEEPTSTNKEDKNIVSTNDSPYPIYMWYDNGTIYWWSEDIHPDLNEDASYMFAYLKNLNDISGLEYFDTSSGANMQGLLCRTSISELTVLCHWDVSNVQNMSIMFSSNSSLQTLESLKNWDTSEVIDMSYMFTYNSSLQSLDGLESWDTSKVTNMSVMFGYNPLLQSLEAIKDWDISNVINAKGIFAKNPLLHSLEFLKDWNTSNVTDMSYMFYGNTNLTSLEGLSNWNTSNVNDMNYMFRECTSLESLLGLENWNVSSVTNFNIMFDNDSLITDSSFLNDWDIQSTATFTQMFRNVPTHPEFTKVPGTWNSAGTFTPTT